MDMAVLEPIRELRIKCVSDGQTVPALDSLIESLRNNQTMARGEKTDRGAWADGLHVKRYMKDKAQVIYHVGCRTSFEPQLQKVARATISLLNKAGVDVGIAGEDEVCCGGRAYEMGYEQEFVRQAEETAARFKRAGAELVVTGCAECYNV